MAKRKKKGFKTDNMTVDQIIHLGDKVLNKMDKRELSHALRTVSLAANKRLKRLEAHGIFDPETEKWSETSNLGIDFDALYYTQGRRFGLGRKKTVTRSQIYKEFARVRNFMKAGSTTIAGAIELRKKREKALFGATSEELTRGMSKADKIQAMADIKDIMTDVYSEFHKWKEEAQIEGGYSKAIGNRVLKMLTRRMYNKGMTGEDARADVTKYREQVYKDKQIEKKQTEVPSDFTDLPESNNYPDWF